MDVAARVAHLAHIDDVHNDEAHVSDSLFDSRPLDVPTPGLASVPVDDATGRDAPTRERVPPDTCRSCSAAVIRCITENGKHTVVDAAPVTRGSMTLTASPVPGDKPTAHVVTKDEREQMQRDVDASNAAHDGPERAVLVLYLSHFATCPDAERWRSRKGGKA